MNYAVYITAMNVLIASLTYCPDSLDFNESLWLWRREYDVVLLRIIYKYNTEGDLYFELNDQVWGSVVKHTEVQVIYPTLVRGVLYIIICTECQG